MFIMKSHCHHLSFPSIESLSILYWNVMERLPKSTSPMPWSTDTARWVVNGANVEIPSTSTCMHRNLTWIDKTHALMVWDGFKAQGCMSSMHNVWYCPHFHQLSSCNLIVIIRYSHQWKLCRNSLEMSWKVIHLKVPPPMPLATDRACWLVNGANVQIHQFVLVCFEFDMVR